jgi:hypothetical protein
MLVDLAMLRNAGVVGHRRRGLGGCGLALVGDIVGARGRRHAEREKTNHPRREETKEKAAKHLIDC